MLSALSFPKFPAWRRNLTPLPKIHKSDPLCTLLVRTGFCFSIVETIEGCAWLCCGACFGLEVKDGVVRDYSEKPRPTIRNPMGDPFMMAEAEKKRRRDEEQRERDYLEIIKINAGAHHHVHGSDVKVRLWRKFPLPGIRSRGNRSSQECFHSPHTSPTHRSLGRASSDTGQKHRSHIRKSCGTLVLFAPQSRLLKTCQRWP